MKVPTRLGRSRLMTISETCSATKVDGVQLNESVSIYPENISEGDDDRDSGHAEQVSNMQDINDQCASRTSVLQQIQLLCEKEEVNAPATVLDAHMLINQRLADIIENSVLSTALIAGSDALKVEKNGCREKLI